MQITVSSFTIQPAMALSTTEVILRLWYNASYLDSTGQAVEGGTATTGNQFRITCTVSNGIITVPAFVVYSTLDALVPNPQSIQIAAQFFKGNSALPIYPFNQSGTPPFWIVPEDLGGTITFEEWTIANQRITLANPPQTFYTAAEVDALIAAAVNNAALNQDVVIGSYTSFANAVSTIGSTATTLVINQAASVTANTTVPSTLTLKFTRKGSLTLSTGVTLIVQGPIEADPVKIFFNAQASQGTVSLTTQSLQEVYPEWWGSSPTAAAAVNTSALQAAIIGAYGSNRTNGSGLWAYNRILKFSGIYSINDELNVYHMIGFYWQGQNKFNSGIRQTVANKKIINGQSVAYGVFSNLMFQGGASSNTNLVDLDYDGAQGSDLRPQNVTFQDCVVQNNNFSGNFGTGYIGVQIAKSGSGAQGDNIRFYNCYANGFLQAALQIGGGANGTATALAQNAIELEWNGGDIQGCPLYGIAVYGGAINVRNATFENGNVTSADGVSQTGYDLFATDSVYQNTVENVRSESLRFASGNWNVKTCAVLGPQTTFTTVWPSIPGSTSFINQLVTGSVYGGDGKMYRVTNVGTFGGLTTTTATGGSATTVVKAGAGWTVNAFLGQRVTIMTGSGKYQYGVITGNTADTLTCAAGFVSDYKLKADTGVPVVITAPDATSTFLIEPDWGSAPTSSGSVSFTALDIVTLGDANNARPFTGHVENFLGGLGTRIYFNTGSILNATFTRADWFGSNTNILDQTYVATFYDNVLIQRYGAAAEEYVSWSIPRNGLTPSFTDFSYIQNGRQWTISSAGDPNGGSGFIDVGWGRGDGIAFNDPNAVSRNIFAYKGIMGSETPAGTNQGGNPTRLQGGLATGSGAPGKLEFWGGPTPGASASTVRDGSRLAYIDYTGLNLTDGPILTEGRLSSTAAVDMNTATATTLFTCPTGKSCIVTKVIVRNASTSLTTASYSFGWTGAAFNDVIANATHTELTGATLYTVISAKVGATLGTSTGIFKVLLNTLQGGAATITIDVYGITF